VTGMRTLALALALLAAGAAQAASPDEVKQQIEKAYGVQVLQVTPADLDGKKVYDVRVMRKADGGNGAFAVTTLAVDAETGKLVPAFRHKASGYTMPDSIEGDPRQIFVPKSGATWK
jgi:Peptidase propeptide and YPEB domain